MRDFTQTAEPSGRRKGGQVAGIALSDPEARGNPLALRPPAGAGCASSNPGQSRVAPRSIPRTNGSPWKWKITRSITATLKAPSRKANTAEVQCQLWDRGFWRPEGELSAEAQLKKGELKFQVAGQRLQGSFVLVRMKGDRYGGKRTNWLLIKHRDAYAKGCEGRRRNDERGSLGRIGSTDGARSPPARDARRNRSC